MPTIRHKSSFST